MFSKLRSQLSALVKFHFKFTSTDLIDLSSGAISNDLQWPLTRFQGHVVTIDAFDVLYVQLMHNLLR